MASPTTFSTVTYASASPTDEYYTPIPTCTMTIKPDKNGYVPPGTCDAQYDYYPSFGAAVVAGAIFGALSFAHIGQAIRFKKGFCWVLIMGALWETASYGTRAASTRDQLNTTKLLMSQIFVLLAPLWLNAFDYMVLGRMIYFFTPTHSIFRIRATTLSVYFVLLDISSFVVQMVGTLMINSTGPSMWQGIHIYMGGLGLQEFFLVVFFGFGIKFHTVMLDLERKDQLPLDKQNWRRLLYTLYGSLSLITVRIIFRLIEFSAGTGTTNPLPYHEFYFYIFDAFPMAIAILIMSITHPGSVLQGPDSVFPKSQSKCCGKRKAKKAARKEEKAARKEAKALVAEERKESKRREKENRKGRGKGEYIELLK